MNNPKVYPQAPYELNGLLKVEQEGIDLLTHVAIAAMQAHWSDEGVGLNEIDSVVGTSFDLAEKFLKERETRLNQIK